MELSIVIDATLESTPSEQAKYAAFAHINAPNHTVLEAVNNAVLKVVREKRSRVKVTRENLTLVLRGPSGSSVAQLREIAKTAVQNAGHTPKFRAPQR